MRQRGVNFPTRCGLGTTGRAAGHSDLGAQCPLGVQWRLNTATGEIVLLIRERSHRDDGAAFVEALGQLRQDLPTLLVWDNAPPHHPKKIQAVAAAAHITLTFLLFHAPELMPCEDLWRLTKFQIAANRASAAVHEQAERAVAWLATLAPSRPLAQERPPRRKVSMAIHLSVKIGRRAVHQDNVLHASSLLFVASAPVARSRALVGADLPFSASLIAVLCCEVRETVTCILAMR